MGDSTAAWRWAFDHTDADVPMMRAEADLVTRLVRQTRLLHRESDPEVLGAVGYDENGDHYAETYPPRGMRCS